MKLLHTWSVEALLGRRMVEVIAIWSLQVLLGRNIGEVITYSVGRGDTSNAYR